MITEEKFREYIEVQKSGVTNMFDLKKVCALTGLIKEEVLDIMKNYSEYAKRWNYD